MSDHDPTHPVQPGRRAFLKGLGAATGLAMLPATTVRGAGSAPVTPSSDAAGASWDAIVIGGGFAGVSAARELCHAGRRTLLLEARNRLGGRTFTARSGGHHFDLGGTWVHATQPHVWAEVSRYGLPLVETEGAKPDQVIWWSDGQRKEAGLMEMLPLLGFALCEEGPAPEMPRSALIAMGRIDRLMKRFHEGAAEAFPLPFDPLSGDAWRRFDSLSVRDRLDAMSLGTDERALLEGMLGASCNGSFAECGLVDMLRWWALSGLDLQRYSDSVARFRLRDGTVSLIDAMVADGRPDLRLGTAVRRVEQNAAGVTVTTEAGERIAARALVVALPMNVLASIEFSPALDPVKIAAFRERHAGAGTKLYVRVRGPVPRFVAFAQESDPLSMLFTSERGETESVLIGFGTSPRALDLHDVAAVQDVVRRFLPGAEVIDTIAYDWHLDPYSLGTWCILRPGQMSRALVALRETEGRVHFAGGDLALGWRGFIDGAIESGVRVGREVAERLARESNAPATGAREAALAPAREHAPTEASAGAASAHAAAPPGAPLPATARACEVCHPTSAGAPAGVGPSLHGVVGRDVASDPRFAYSEALAKREGAWTAAELDAFLANPAAAAPGTKMAFGGIADPQERAAVIEWLSRLR